MGNAGGLYRFFDSGPFGNQTAFDAVGTGANPTRRAVDQGSDGLQIRTKHSLRAVVSMTHGVAYGRTFAAHVTNPSHTALLGQC